MAKDTVQLDIVTPARQLVSAEAARVVLPGEMGDMTILPRHTPLISTLRPGELRYQANGHWQEMVVSGGFVEVAQDRVTVLAEAAEYIHEINVEQAKDAHARTKAALAKLNAYDPESVARERDFRKAAATVRAAARRGR